MAVKQVDWKIQSRIRPHIQYKLRVLFTLIAPVPDCGHDHLFGLLVPHHAEERRARMSRAKAEIHMRAISPPLLLEFELLLKNLVMSQISGNTNDYKLCQFVTILIERPKYQIVSKEAKGLPTLSCPILFDKVGTTTKPYENLTASDLW